MLTEARACAAAVAEAEAPLYARLETLLEPWLRLRTLTELDRKTLVGLWETCRQLDAELPAPRTGIGVWPILASLLVGLAVAGVSLLVLLQRR